jgi:putative tryptophan/tyrosine transport system substrate-binding protein
MDRRTFLAGTGAVLLTAPLAVEAQQAARIRRVGLYATTDPKRWFSGYLRELGWVDGQNIVIDWQSRPAVSDPQIAAQEVADIERRQLDVAVLGGPNWIRAAMKATQKVPLVAIDLESDPVASGFVRSLARPGMNISGVWLDLPELAGKQLQFLRELLPTINRIVVLWDDKLGGPQLTAAQSAASSMKLMLRPVALRGIPDIDDTWKQVVAANPQAILSLTAPVVFQLQTRIAELAVLHRLPSICGFSTYAERGGLAAYGPDFPSMWRQTAVYVDRILRGAKVSELPVERPTKFSLILNSKAAKALGLTIPPSLLGRADEVIE